jgi:rhodanese-related sulfurtransferase
MEIPEITCGELQRRLGDGDELVIVDALSPLSFAHSRLPGAVNIPPERVDELASRRIPDRASEIVVYCMSRDCDASVETAERLRELGYANVFHFAGGKREWRQAGLPLESGSEVRVTRARLSPD